MARERGRDQKIPPKLVAVAGFDVKFMSLLPYESKQRLKHNQTYGISACAAQL
jgi:hypothetical protein